MTANVRNCVVGHALVEKARRGNSFRLSLPNANAFPVSAPVAPNCIDRNGSGSEEDQDEGHRAECESELVSSGTQQAMLPMDFSNCHAHVQEDKKRG